ncbi:zf-HC2 domain-containing protein [candidate division WOR-3 bacterium]|nr:zf-HC2 domain-containing protein [candidate division WOR-3 bacterium]
MIKSCSDFLEALYDYSFKDMDESDLASFLDHAEKCPACKKAYENTLFISEVLDKTTAPQVIPIHRFAYPKTNSRVFLMSRILVAAALFTFFILLTLPQKELINNTDLREANSALFEVSFFSSPEILERAVYESRTLQAESLYYYQEDMYFLLNSIDEDEFVSLNNKLKKDLFFKTSVGGIL